ncbi:MAG TPA: hypothetical protein VF680_09235 [Allosphingosinicella sp.]|jgi:hypothetical protein
MNALQPLPVGQRPSVPASLTFSGRFTRSPYCGTLYEAEMSVLPLHKPSEFRHVQDFEQRTSTPVLLSPSQRYRFLSELIAGVTQAVPQLTLSLVRLGAPDYKTQLPRRLLQPDVLLSHDPWLFLPSLAANENKCTLVVWQELLTDSVEPGDNRLSLTLLGESGTDAFLHYIDTAPLLSALGDRRIESAVP